MKVIQIMNGVVNVEHLYLDLIVVVIYLIYKVNFVSCFLYVVFLWVIKIEDLF